MYFHTDSRCSFLKIRFDSLLRFGVEHKAFLDFVIGEPIQIEIYDCSGVKVAECLDHCWWLRHRCGSHWESSQQVGCNWKCGEEMYCRCSLFFYDWVILFISVYANLSIGKSRYSIKYNKLLWLVRYKYHLRRNGHITILHLEDMCGVIWRSN
jgi:hypothetical protein